MSKRLIAKITALLLVAVLFVAACGEGGGGGQGEALGMFAALAAIQETFPSSMPEGQGVGGTLYYGRAVSSPWAGDFSPGFSLTVDDGIISDFMFGAVLSINEANMFSHEGPGWFEFDRDANTFTMHLHDDTNWYWHDGVPVTMYDLLFAYEVIAHPDLHSPRFGAATNTNTIVGIDEYREDPSRGISGITVFNNGRSITLEFPALEPTMLYAGSIWSTPLPRHHLEHIPFAELPTHPNMRTNIVGNGPFMWTGRFVDGQEVILAANPNYWLGRPRVDYINISGIEPSLVGEAMLAGTFDIINFNVLFLPDYQDAFEGTVTLLSALDRLFTFMGFRYGTMDHDAQTFTQVESLISCIYLRRALGYARDDITAADMVFNNMRFPLSTTVIPWSGPFMREDMVGFSEFNPDLANQLLDEAGYVWNEGEPFRRHKDTGEFFHLVWAIADNPTNQLLVPQHLNDWREYIGIDVRLWQGGLMEFNDRIQTLQFDTDNGGIHMFDAGWMKGANPNPRALWGVTTHNDTRWQHPETDAILDRIDSDAAWDTNYLMQAFADWQEAIYRHAAWIPVMTGVSLQAVNNRVLNYSVQRQDGVRNGGLGAFHLWALTQDAPYRGN
jgi:peptide/nickel transport system substrate-binding protein